jgi:Fe-S-cluster containining protein
MTKYKCNKCGMCCRVICLNGSMFDFLRLNTLNGDTGFIINNFRMITREEALKINPYLENWFKNTTNKYYTYKCKQFDEKKKLCLIHKNKPYMCKGYPYYDKTDKRLFKEDAYTENCGYIFKAKRG